MATVKKGILTRAGEWWVHLRPYGKRDFWKGERKAAAVDIADRVGEAVGLDAIDREIDWMVGRDPSSGCVFCDLGLEPEDGFHQAHMGVFVFCRKGDL